MIVFTFFGRYLLTCIVGQRRGAAGHTESRRQCVIVFTFFGRYLLTCIVGQRRGAAGHVESRRGLPRGKSRLLLCNKNSLVLPTSAQLFFVGAGLRARPQDFSKGNTGSGKNGKIALAARFHSALARARGCLREFGVPGGTGEPPARVPHAKTFHRNLLAPLLRFFAGKEFRPVRRATKDPVFGICHL